MTYEEAMQDISIAQKALADAKLDMVVSDDDLLCEVYCVTPFHWQTFYLRVYDNNNKYTLLYAKPYVKNLLGSEIISVSFQDILKVKNHPACEGKIICGIKKFRKDNQTIVSLVNCLPLAEEIHKEPLLAIDGITTVIINKTSVPEKTLFFTSEEKEFCNNSYSEESVEFLNNLCVHIEKLIGNSTTDSKLFTENKNHDSEYARICKKLGFIPSEYTVEADTEDDTWVNPFSTLTIEEQDYLYDNGYLNTHKR